MIKTILKRTKPTTSQLQPEPEPMAASEPSPAPQPVADPKPIDQSPRALALRAAEAAGWSPGDEQPMAEICRYQPSKMFLLVMVNDWPEPVICRVKDALSWLPVNPPFNRLTCRFTGTATAEGRLIFESADLCKAGRLRRQR